MGAQHATSDTSLRVTILRALPDDIWIVIILHLDLLSLAQCEQVSRPLCDIIRQSVTIQYHKELMASGRLDRYPVSDASPLSERLERLCRLEDSLSLLSFLDRPPHMLNRVIPPIAPLSSPDLNDHDHDHDHDHADGDADADADADGARGFELALDLLTFTASKLQSGVLVQTCFASDHFATPLLSWARVSPPPSPTLESAVSGDAGGSEPRPRWGGMWALPRGEFHSWVFDSAADLIVLLRRPRDGMETSSDHLLALSLRTGEPHPEARQTVFELPGECWRFRQLALAGDTVAVWDRETPEVALVNWRTGEINSVSHTSEGNYSFDIGFLAPDAYFVFREDIPAMEICTLSSSSSHFHTIASFRLPSPRPDFGIRRLCSVTWHHWYLASPAHRSSSPSGSFDGSSTPYALEHNILCLEWERYAIVVDKEDGDSYFEGRGFNRLVVDTRGILRLAKQHPSTTSTSSSSKSKSSLHPKVEISWDVWGPRLSRFLGAEESRRSTRLQFSGSKVLCLFRPGDTGSRGSESSTGTAMLKMMDFAPTARRYEHRLAVLRATDTEAGLVERDVSESALRLLRGCHFVDAVTPLEAVFPPFYAEDVGSGLPYWTLVRDLAPDDDWREFIVDDSHIVVRCEDPDPRVYAF